MSIITEISTILQAGKTKLLTEKVREALNEGFSAQEILNDGLLKGMAEVGVKFKANDIFVPEVLMAARALNKGTEILREKLVQEGAKPIGKVVIATVKGDMHDIGKNLVKMMLQGTGFEVVDLGVDISENAIVEAVKENQPDILCLSALLTTTMNQQGVVIEALKNASLRDKVKVMVGGAPVTQAFCDEIGADVYTADAASCAQVAKTFVS